MKNIVTTLIFLTAFLHINGQNNINYVNEGVFDYSLLEDACLYISKRPYITGKGHILWMKKINEKSIVYRHFCSGSNNQNLPFVWSKTRDNLFSIGLFYYNSYRISNIYYRKFEIRDSLEMKELKDVEITAKELIFTPFANYFRSFIKLRHRPNQEKIREIENSLSFDIYAVNDKKLQFYLRDSSVFYVWECLIPEKGSVGEWKQLSVYATADIDLEYPPIKYSESFNKEKLKYNAINDSLFFKGHFKVINQNDNKYIINREHGTIYLLTDKKIIAIGKVQFKKVYPKLRGKALFIEDRDNNEIIFFSSVKWEKTKYPKPHIKIMNKKEMQKKFQYVLE